MGQEQEAPVGRVCPASSLAGRHPMRAIRISSHGLRDDPALDWPHDPSQSRSRRELSGRSSPVPPRGTPAPRVWPAAWLLLLGILAGTASAAEVSPQSLRHYQLLETTLKRYTDLAADPTLTVLPALPARSIASRDAYAGIPELRRLLIALGDLAPAPPVQHPVPETASPEAAPPQPAVLDAPLIAALIRFQQRHGLEPDGILGPATWRALTTPLSRRVQQIERTLERWRQLPANPGQRAIFINIPQFLLIGMHAMGEPEAQMLRMNVVVGRNLERLRTPTLVADMTHLVFRPYWDVPQSIAVGELLPEIRARQGYLESRQLEVVNAAGQIVEPTAENLAAVASGTMRLRQRPGPGNALGAVKFVLPNPHNVHLHDTPEQALFGRSRRAFSHGCVRVAEPQALAEFVLRGDPQWTPERIREAMSGSEPLQVDLKEPVRVYIVYGTAIARENGEVLFFDDVYGLDGG